MHNNKAQELQLPGLVKQPQSTKDHSARSAGAQGLFCPGGGRYRQ